MRDRMHDHMSPPQAQMHPPSIKLAPIGAEPTLFMQRPNCAFTVHEASCNVLRRDAIMSQE